jgi:hypothetical protein
MKILESTDERLVIGNEAYFVELEKLMNLQLIVSVILTVCFLPIWMNLYCFAQRDWRNKSFIFYFIINSILISVFYSGRIKGGDYWLILFLYSIPFIRMLVLIGEAGIPKSECLTFDRNKNVLIVIKFKCLFWNRSIQYPLSDLLSARIYTKFVYTGSMNGIYVDTVQMARRRRRDGKVVVFGVACGSDANFLVQKINMFLHA